MQRELPFTVSRTESFFEKLNEWIGDVFYDLLPESGFEIRDEQVYMAFQLEKAFKEKQVIFAEAGVGTGKTIVYLLYALCYARYLNKPAIIACADETLIEQLVKKEGDIAKLEKALDLQIDVRLAKSREQYICLNKLDGALIMNEGSFNFVFDNLPEFVNSTTSMQKFTRYGDRRDYPELTDEQWEKIAWDPLQDCFTCTKRHRCGQTLHREHYRTAKDLIVCSHDFYMEHIWTKDSRKREGQLPLLPDSSCVVFDEGHLLEFACQKALTHRFTEQTLETLLTRLMGNDVREKTLHMMEDAIEKNELFFHSLADVAKEVRGSEKQIIEKSPEVTKIGKQLMGLLEKVEEELVFESELFVMNEYDLKIVEEYLEQIVYSLSLFVGSSKGITWFENNNGERTLVIMPRMVEDIMRSEVFSQKKPFVFSSATLSENQSFEYTAKSLGIDQYLSFSVNSPFDYESNMSIYINRFSVNHFEAKASYAIEKINEAGGGSLVLFTDRKELLSFKKFSKGKIEYPIYFEGDAEIGTLVSRFQNESDAVLCAVHLWEGLDIPGESLRNVIIFSLPYPPNDPVFSAKRQGLEHPFEEVDLPYMLLRLRQGIGRLIRTHTDKGSVHLLINEPIDEAVMNKVLAVLPTDPRKMSSLGK